MAQDGSYEVAWKGSAFPYLMNHPSGFLKTENYGSAKHGHGEAHGHGYAHNVAPSSSSARTGTWDGPAPKGYLGGAKPESLPAPPDAGTVACQELDFMRLPSGAAMPLVGFNTDTVTSAEAIKQALASGCHHFDCSEVSGKEAMVGEGLKGAIAQHREKLFISSKVWNTHHKAADVRASCEASMAKLGVTYLDLYMLHWPEAWAADIKDDFETPVTDTSVSIQDTWRAMEALVDEGLVKHIGVCNFSLKQVEELLESCRIKPVVNQLELHPLLSQRKLVGVCFRKGVQCVSYSPMVCLEEFSKNPVVQRVAAESNKTPEQILVKYNLQRGVPIMLPESAAINKDLVFGSMSWRLTNTHKVSIDSAEKGKRFESPKWKVWADPEEGGIPKPSLVLA